MLRVKLEIIRKRKIMETTEKIVESYCRYVKGCFTLPNIRCDGQYEIDLLAISVGNDSIERYHVECGVSISGSYSKLTNKEFSTNDLKERVKAAGQRRTLGYFIDRKFNVPEVRKELQKYGFVDANYTRVVVTWDATEDAEKEAAMQGVKIWHFPDLLKAIAEAHTKERKYFTDDTARTIQLFAMSQTKK